MKGKVAGNRKAGETKLVAEKVGEKEIQGEVE